MMFPLTLLKYIGSLLELRIILNSNSVCSMVKNDEKTIESLTDRF